MAIQPYLKRIREHGGHDLPESEIAAVFVPDQLSGRRRIEPEHAVLDGIDHPLSRAVLQLVELLAGHPRGGACRAPQRGPVAPSHVATKTPTVSKLLGVGALARLSPRLTKSPARPPLFGVRASGKIRPRILFVLHFLARTGLESGLASAKPGTAPSGHGQARQDACPGKRDTRRGAGQGGMRWVRRLSRGRRHTG